MEQNKLTCQDFTQNHVEKATSFGNYTMDKQEVEIWLAFTLVIAVSNSSRCSKYEPFTDKLQPYFVACKLQSTSTSTDVFCINFSDRWFNQRSKKPTRQVYMFDTKKLEKNHEHHNNGNEKIVSNFKKKCHKQIMLKNFVL